jgi:phosphatidylserine decarboxylase
LLIHKEGVSILIKLLLGLSLVCLAVFYYIPSIYTFALVISVIFFLLVLQFFRNPNRQIVTPNDKKVFAPADGKVVVIEETVETEYFKDKRLQVSIFMSPLNVHVNRNPISGIVNYIKHHEGRYLVAWHPKSSSENERTTVVIENNGAEVLLRQIAGAVAKRIVNYLEEGDTVEQGRDMGFIKFGSRVDLFLPIGTEINVQIGDKVKGNRTVIANL